MTILTLDGIKEYLASRDLKPELQEETQQILAILEFEEQQYPLFARIYDESNLLQMLAFFPFEAKQKALPEVARLLHMFNRELDVPGFGMDETSRTIFFRCMIPSVDTEMDEKLIDAYLQSIKLACQTFSKPIEALAVGATTFDDLMKKAEKAK